MTQYLIYMHTSTISSKSYIGMTSRSIESRWKEHVRESSYGSTRHFHNAIKLYGKSSWVHKTLAYNIDNLDEAFRVEKYFIKKYDTFENGYNLSYGGEGRLGVRLEEYFVTHTWEHSNFKCVKATGAEMIEKYGLPPDAMWSYLLQRYKKCAKQVSGWVIKGRHALPKAKISADDSLVVYHSKHGEYFGTIGEFSVKIGKPLKHIGKIISGKHKSICGWRLSKIEENRTTNRKKVYAYDILDGSLLAVYESSSSASISLGLPRKATMSEWLSYTDNCKVHKGVRYSYLNEYLAGDKNLGVRQ